MMSGIRSSHPLIQSLVFIGALSVLGLGALLGGCRNPSPPAQSPQPIDESTDPHRAVDAQGWTQLTLNANLAITHVDNTGHWDTNQNYCMQQASGGLDLHPWNQFADLVNQAIQAPVSAQDTCFDTVCPIGTFSYDDKIVATLEDGGTRVLFQEKSGQICTRIGDPEAAEKLLQMLSEIAISADRQDCDRPYYRCGTLMN